MYNPFAKLPSRQQRFIITTILITMIVFVVGAIAIPTSRAILNRQTEIQSSLELMERQYQEAQKSKRTLRELASVLDRITPFSDAFLKKSNERDFLTNLESVATTHNVTQTFSIEPDKTQSSIRGVVTYLLTTQAQGTFTQLMSYLHAIQQQPVTISIQTVTFNTTATRRGETKESTTDPQISMTLSAKVYATQ